MSEIEKLKNNKIYNCKDDVIAQNVNNAYELCDNYRNIYPKENTILKELFKTIGDNSTIVPPLHVDFGWNTTIGHDTFINANVTILDSAKVTIGNNVFIGPNVTIICPVHPIDFPTRNNGFEKSLPVIIEDNVWICANVIIMPGVTIKAGSVIGAGTLVAKEVANNTLRYANVEKKINQTVIDSKFEELNKDL